MPYCTNCGSETTDKMLFCHKCGSELIIPKADAKSSKPLSSATDAEVNKQEDTPGREIKKGRLYKQWVKHAGLPAEETPSIKVPRDMPVRRENNARNSLLFYITLGVAILVGTGLVLLLAKIW